MEHAWWTTSSLSAPGFAGGGDGGIGAVEINGEPVDTHKQHVLRRGDVVVLRTPGGGGYGDPAERNATLVERDRELGYVP